MRSRLRRSSLGVMELIVAAHASFARVVVLYLVLLGGWGIAAGLRGKAPSGSYLGALVIAEGVALLQGLLGIANLLARPPQNTIHLLYGVALAFALPLAWSYTRGRPGGRVSLMLGVAALFAAGLGVRGLTTGG